MSVIRLATLLAALVALAVAPAAAHASGSDVVKDCADGSLSGHYSQRDYSEALAHLPADLDEYTDCRDIIRRAQLAGAGGGSNGGGSSSGGVTGGVGGGGSGGDDGTGGGGFVDPLATATPAERASFAKAVKAGSAPIVLDGRPVTPGSLGGAEGTSLTDLPTPLLVVLALLLAAGISAATLAARRLVLDRRTA